jgi:hypothetical protein
MKTNIKYVMLLAFALSLFAVESKAQKAVVKTKADGVHISQYAKVMYGGNDKKPLKQIAKTVIFSYKGTPGANNNTNSIHPTPIEPTTAQPAIIGTKDNQHVINTNNNQLYIDKKH